ncbi:hypothetical protein [Jeotgalicoccus sp. WY2]|uniref:hypothetical protein n=1 Tax=Jeotgalicoccus sp. WY2 TaxID=2708346 RepID=UPI001BD45DF5|nr:hypothetical protein [Jeotgalicoccus sp. WY2]
MIGNFRSPFDDTALNKLNLISNFVDQFDGTRLYEVSYNLFNKETVGNGSVDGDTGDINDDGFRHAVIEVKPNTPYVMTSKGRGALLTATGEHVQKILSSTTSFVTPSNVHLYKVTLGSAQIDTFMIHEGTVLKPYKPWGVEPSPLLFDQDFLDEVNDAREYFENVDALGLNYGKDFPLKSVALGSTTQEPIAQRVKNIVLDAKVYGAKTGYYYRVDFVANGFVTSGKARYGINVREIPVGSATGPYIFKYDDDASPENHQNANVQKLSDGIDTIIADGGDIIVSVTVDRAAISESSNPTFLNLNSGAGSSPTAVIDPVNHFF